VTNGVPMPVPAVPPPDRGALSGPVAGISFIAGVALAARAQGQHGRVAASLGRER
jgi:hypothetical protein